MHTADWIVLALYLVGTVGIGVLLGRLVKDSSDLFAAGGQSPWWASGLSAFMTMFSANTFVVWGGMAYEHGVVAIVVNLCYGIAALLAGYTVAGRWKRLGIRTPAEFVKNRFGGAALHFYTWAVMIFRLFGAAGALYAIATLMVAVTRGSDTAATVQGMPPALVAAILVFGAVVVVYTMIGGLWAVLMTDVIQFIVLNVAVIFVIPLIIADIGGLGTFLEQAPTGFFSPTSGPKYTWFFLFGWVAIHYFMIGAEFAFVQRYICVPTPSDARSGTLLFGFLYLFSPFLWLLPPLLWRVQSPIPEGATAGVIRGLKEEAYIKSCRHVLPVGMIGLMMAAMFSATASLVSSQLNVFSGVLTHDIYRPLRKAVTEKGLLTAGRVFTVLLGALIAGIALLIPRLGGAEKMIVAVTELMVVPLLAPILWGLLSRRVEASALWLTAGICIPLGLLLHFGFAEPGSDAKGAGFLHELKSRGGFWLWLSFNSITLVGVVLPVLIMLALQATTRGESLRWRQIEELGQRYTRTQAPAQRSPLPTRIVGCSLLVLGTGMSLLIPLNPNRWSTIALFSGAVAAIGLLVLCHSNQSKPPHS
ncbi:MAG: sodium:solute symporter family transporter [Luteolibacter sp.]